MKHALTALLPLAVALSACATQPDSLDAYADRCQRYGFPAGTQELLDCIIGIAETDALVTQAYGHPIQRNTISDIGHVLTSTANGIRANERHPHHDYPVPTTHRSGATEAIDREIRNCLRRNQPPNC